jgi:hypothetical protein
MISNVRVVKGTALYTTTFTPSTTPLTTTSQGATASEVILLACQNSTFTDNSSYNLTITPYGNVYPLEYNPFGFTTTAGVNYDPSVRGGSGYFATTSNYITYAPGNTASFGTGDFTVECWVYPQNSALDISMPSVTTSTWSLLTYNNQLYWKESGSNLGGTGYGTVAQNAWNHLAVCRASGTLKMFINGVQVYSAVNSFNYSGTGTTRSIGPYGGGGTPYYVSDFKIHNQTALYSGAFVPPKRVTSVAGEVLSLPFNDAPIYDATARANINTIGDAKVSNAVKKYGAGSMYFDGSGDGLVTLPLVSTYYNNMTNPGSQYINTIEMWIYPTTLTSPRGHLIGAWTGSNGWTYDIDTSGRIFISNNGAGTTMTSMTGAAAITTNAWQHLAFVNDGTDIKIYLDGTLVATKTGGSACGAPSTSLYIGVRSDNSLPFQGYIDDVRITKGVARYTSNFTPPEKHRV